MASEKEPLYTPLAEEQENHSLIIQPSRSAEFWKRLFFVLLAVFLINSLTMGILVAKYLRLRNCASLTPISDVVDPYSPAAGHFGYTNKFLTSVPDTPNFMGKPRPELDDAWHDLLEGTLIRVTEEELQKAGNSTSVAYADGSYVAGLGISQTTQAIHVP